MARLSGLKIEDLIVGTGPTALRGATVKTHYRLFLNRGDELRGSYDYSEPCTFCIGKRQVIAGLEHGVVGMRAGGKRRIRVPPHLAYREQGVAGLVPPNAVLIFEVELLSVKFEKRSSS